MQYLYIKGTEELFVLFHGTGGNENSLLGLTGEIDPYASVLSFEGNVGRGINRRFFAPLISGRVDREELKTRVDEFFKMWDNLEEVKVAKKINFIGYSNGANFILALLEERPDIADKTYILHPSDLGWKYTKKAEKNEIYFTVGAKDFIAPAGDIVQLKNKIETVIFPKTELLLLDSGHELNENEILKLKEVYK